MSNLSERKIRYLVINSIGTRGTTSHRLIIGGYENMKDLEKVLKQLGFPKGFDYAGKK